MNGLAATFADHALARRTPAGLLPLGGRMTSTYGHLTWIQTSEADKARAVILNASANEDHGHITLETDTVLSMTVAIGVAAAAPDEVVVLPAVPYGLNEHLKDFSGVIWTPPETLSAFVRDTTKSLAHQGFRRVLGVNSHGSDHPVLDLAAHKTVIDTLILSHGDHH
jgi:creatinine amidohydrolase